MDVVTAVRARGGIARSAELIRSGVGRHAIAVALASGELVRIRRVWVATPDADPHLLAAARHGVVISCVSRARRLGLWVLDESLTHVAAPPHAGEVRVQNAVVHWRRPLVPRHPHALEDSVENALVLVASCQPHEVALAVWESALRKGVIDRQVIERLPLPERARRLLEAANPHADSGLESLVLTRLGWMGVRILPQAWIHGHRVDFLIGDRLVLQIDGGHHVGAQRSRDIAHDAELMLRGYHVIRLGYGDVVDDWARVQARIQLAVAQGLHRAA